MERINIIGAGLAGLSAAITLARGGVGCNLISLQHSERAQSVLAEGGINAALDTMGQQDTFWEHYKDTMTGGGQLADADAVYGLTKHAPDIVRWLTALGVPFHMEQGRLILRNFGGQKKKRTAYAKSSTGKMIVSALIDEARKYEAAGVIERYPHHEFIRLLVDGENGKKSCKGVRIRDTYSGELYDFSGMVILASGGMNGIFPGMTTGTVQNSGDVTATVFAQGVTLSNLEMLQYHPTTIGISGKRCLVTEAARGEGGRLYILRDGAPWYFMEEKYPELKNLMPRDVVSREMYFAARREDCGGQVYLDMTGLSDEIWKKKLSDLREELRRYLGIDPAKEPIPVEPGIHYFMGGIDVDVYHRTNIQNLYAAGECTSQYHGANRLGGNSMLGAIYGGKVAAEHIMSAAGAYFPKEMQKTGAAPAGNSDASERIAVMTDGKAPVLCTVSAEPLTEEASPDFIMRLSKILSDGLGIVRSGQRLQKALYDVQEVEAEAKNLREKNRTALAGAMLRSAMMRTESRGAHYREDYPKKDEALRKKLTASCQEGTVSLNFRQLCDEPEATANDCDLQ